MITLKRAVTTALEQAKDAHEAADTALRTWDDETNRLAREAADAVKAARRDEAARLSRARHDTYVAMRAAENEAVTLHEWNGKRVVYVEEIHDYWTNRPTGNFKDPVFGIVETYKHGAQMPENLGWRMRNMKPGTPFIRLLKKDGSVGLKVVEFEAKWKLDEA